MDKRIVALRDWGCDVQGAMARMLGDEGFYIECLNGVVDDPSFALLTEALQQKDATVAFDSAHALKGVLVNLGLTPMYDKVVEIVNPLRAGQIDHLESKNAELLQMRAQLIKLMRQ